MPRVQRLGSFAYLTPRSIFHACSSESSSESLTFFKAVVEMRIVLMMATSTTSAMRKMELNIVLMAKDTK